MDRWYESCIFPLRQVFCVSRIPNYVIISHTTHMQTYCVSCLSCMNPLGFSMWSTKWDHVSCGGDKPQTKAQDTQLQGSVPVRAHEEFNREYICATRQNVKRWKEDCNILLIRYTNVMYRCECKWPIQWFKGSIYPSIHFIPFIQFRVVGGLSLFQRS